MLSKDDQLLFMRLKDELDISYPSASKYNREGVYPESVALKAERISNGKLIASRMCPNTLGKPLPSHRNLAAHCLNFFQTKPEGATMTLLIAVVTFLEEQQPTLYADLIDRIRLEGGGDEFIANREAHRGNF